MVYVGLLCPHIDRTQYRAHERIRDYNLEPAILGTCKQVCDEASRVLYGKNGTVLIRTDKHAYPSVRKWEEYRMAEVVGGDIGGLPVLTMELSVLQQYQPKSKPRAKSKSKAKSKSVPKEGVVFIGFLSALPQICRSVSSYSSPHRLQLVVNMENLIGRPPDTRLQTLSYCLESLCEVRGIGHAVILTENQHRGTATRTAELMKTSIDTPEDALSIACAYEARVLRYSKEKRWNDARDTLHNALEFFKTLRLFGTTGRKTDKLEMKKINMQWDHVSYCLKVGRTGDVHHYIRQMFQSRQPQKGYGDRTADAHYAIGKAFEIDGFVNSAVYSFLQALITAPGHIEADRAIDHLEERVESSLKPEDVMAKLNIECVLKEVRHRVPYCVRLTESQERHLVKGFVARYGDIEGLLDGYSGVSAI